MNFLPGCPAIKIYIDGPIKTLQSKLELSNNQNNQKGEEENCTDLY